MKPGTKVTLPEQLKNKAAEVVTEGMTVVFLPLQPTVGKHTHIIKSSILLSEVTSPPFFDFNSAVVPVHMNVTRFRPLSLTTKVQSINQHAEPPTEVTSDPVYDVDSAVGPLLMNVTRRRPSNSVSQVQPTNQFTESSQFVKLNLSPTTELGSQFQSEMPSLQRSMSPSIISPSFASPPAHSTKPSCHESNISVESILTQLCTNVSNIRPSSLVNQAQSSMQPQKISATISKEGLPLASPPSPATFSRFPV